MNSMDLFKEPTMSVENTVNEIKLLAGSYETWKGAEEVYNYDRENTTLKQLDNMKNSLKIRQREAVHNLVRYIYLFWKRMIEMGDDAVSTAKQYKYTYGFDNFAESDESMVQMLVRTKEKPAFPWNWENAVWRVENRESRLNKEYCENMRVLYCHVTCWVRDHDEDWEFSIPIKFLDPNYDIKSDGLFMKDYELTRYNSLYRKLFLTTDREKQRKIIKLFSPEIINCMLKVEDRDISGYEDLLVEDKI